MLLSQMQNYKDNLNELVITKTLQYNLTSITSVIGDQRQWVTKQKNTLLNSHNNWNLKLFKETHR